MSVGRTGLVLIAAAGALVVGCPNGGPGDDDDATTPDAPCAPVPSGGSGGATGSSWLTVPGWSTDDGANAPDYEVVVYAPDGLSWPAPLAMLTANPVPADRGSIEQIVYEFIGDGLDDWAETYGYVFAFPVAGGTEGGQLGFRTAQDEPYMGDALDAVAGAFDIDLNSVHLFGRSGGGRIAMQVAQFHAERIASVMSLAGPQPFPNWESGEPTWARGVGGLFVHDEADPVVSRPTVLDTVAMFEAQGGVVETFFDYTGGHDWDAAQVEPRMADFFDRTCIE